MPCLATKVIRQKRLHLEGNHIVVQNNIQYYPHSEIRSLITLNATLPSLSHTDWLDTVLVRTRWSENRSIYRMGLAYFTRTNKYQLDRYFYATLLPYVSLCCPKIKFTKKLITTILDQVKSPICAHNWTIKSQTVRSESWNLWTTHFRPCKTLILNEYSTVTHKVIRKKRLIYRSGSTYFTMATELTNAWFFGAHLLTFLDMFSMWLNYMIEIIFSLRIKYYDSRNWDNFVMRKISIFHDVNYKYILQ